MRYKAYVYILKHRTQVSMRYGYYYTFAEASNAIKHLKSINTIDSFYIEERYE